MRRFTSLSVLFCLLTFSALSASAATINVGDHNLQPNLAGQEIQFFITGGEMISGVNIYLQVGDGGPEKGDYGFAAGTSGPKITSLDLKTGTIFKDEADSAIDLIGIPQVAQYYIAITRANGTVPASGLLMTAYLDTTGFTGGTWNLAMKETIDGTYSSNLGVSSFALDITNGSITIVPEPASLGLALLGGVMLLNRRRTALLV